MKTLLSALLLLLLTPLSSWSQTEPAPTDTEAYPLRLEPWHMRTGGWGFSFPPHFLESSYLMNLGLEVLFTPHPDHNWGLHVGSWYPVTTETIRDKVPATAAVSGFYRYYLPDSLFPQHPALSLSRFFLEGRVSIPFQIAAPLPEQPEPIPFGLGLASAFGLESYWGDYNVLYSLGPTLGYSPQQQWAFPLMANVQFKFLFYKDKLSQAYQQYYRQEQNQSPAPLIQTSLTMGTLEGTGISTWIQQPQWGLGFFKGESSQNDSFSASRRPGPQMALKGRYYPTPIHYGPQGYIEGIAATGSNTGLAILAGLEHRERWGLTLNFGMGLEIQNDESAKAVLPNLSAQLGLGFAWGLPHLNESALEPAGS